MYSSSRTIAIEALGDLVGRYDKVIEPKIKEGRFSGLRGDIEEMCIRGVEILNNIPLGSWPGDTYARYFTVITQLKAMISDKLNDNSIEMYRIQARRNINSIDILMGNNSDYIEMKNSAP